MDSDATSAMFVDTSWNTSAVFNASGDFNTSEWINGTLNDTDSEPATDEAPITLGESVTTAFLLTALIVMTICGNILVVMSVFTYRPLTNVQNFYIVSLAVADLFVATVVMPFNVVNFVATKWIFGYPFCLMWLTADVCCCTSSILHLCIIGLDRYWAITDPINYAQKRTKKRVLTSIAMVWTISILIAIPPLVGWNDWQKGSSSAKTGQCMLTEEKGYIIYSSSGSFFIPLVILSTVYIKIFLATRRRLRQKAKQAQKLASAGKGNTTNKKPHSALTTIAAKMSRKSKEPKKTAHFERSSNSDTPSDQDVGNSSAHAETEMTENNQTTNNHSHGPHTNATTDDKPSGGAHLDVPRSSAGSVPSRTPSTTSAGGQETKKEQMKEAEERQQRQRLLPLNRGGTVHRFLEEKQKISLSKERRAAKTLAIIMAVFVACWLPFFLMYVILPFCASCNLSARAANFITWLGYVNSALNPVIYTVFNIDFRRAFKRLLTLEAMQRPGR